MSEPIQLGPRVDYSELWETDGTWVQSMLAGLTPALDEIMAAYVQAARARYQARYPDDPPDSADVPTLLRWVEHQAEWELDDPLAGAYLGAWHACILARAAVEPASLAEGLYNFLHWAERMSRPGVTFTAEQRAQIARMVATPDPPGD